MPAVALAQESHERTGFGVTFQTESTYDGKREEWTLPLGLFASEAQRSCRLALANEPLRGSVRGREADELAARRAQS